MLLKTAGLPKTTSGKVKRRLCREHYIQGSLDSVAECVGYSQAVAAERPLHTGKELKASGVEPNDLATEDASERMHATQSSIAKMVAVLLKISFSKVDVNDPLNAMGIDSLMAVELKTAIEEDLGFEIPVEALFMGASIVDLAAHILWQGTSGKGLETKDGPLGKVLSSGRQSGEPVARACVHKKTSEVHPEYLPFVDFQLR